MSEMVGYKTQEFKFASSSWPLDGYAMGIPGATLLKADDRGIVQVRWAPVGGPAIFINLECRVQCQYGVLLNAQGNLTNSWELHWLPS